MKKLLLFAVTIVALFACTKENITPVDEQKIPINISVGQSTRANDTTFASDDKVGIYVVNYTEEVAGALAASGNQVDNAQFTYNGSAWTPDKPVYWKDRSTAADFYAYYPYGEVADIAAHPFSVKANQSEEANFWASDFLWGKATNVSPSPNPVSITTNHSLSRILVEIKPGKGFTDETWPAADKSIKICGVKTSATIDLSTGVATAAGDKGEIIPLAADAGYKAMMIPQQVADNTKLIVVTVDGVDYVYRKGFTFKANTQHKFSITVNQADGKIDITIGEWTTDDILNEGEAEEEAEPEVVAVPNNQIWYTTTDGKALGKSGGNITSDTYTNGKGVIEFNEDLTKITSGMFKELATLASITLPNSITTIQMEAFYHCENLATINLPNQLETIGERVFSSCSSLVTITLPNSLKSIKKRAFSQCTGLESLTIPSNVTSIYEEIFYSCSNLATIKMEPITPPTIYSNTFSNAEALTTIIVPAESVDEYKNADQWKNYKSKIVASTEN
ncbi:MAG: leucine-rich repeat protein [Alistipes sp.]|nr:leucine-rich repeat protein [Alistipes sp.]